MLIDSLLGQLLVSPAPPWREKWVNTSGWISFQGIVCRAVKESIFSGIRG